MTAGAALLGHPRQAHDDGVAIIMTYSERTERLHSADDVLDDLCSVNAD